MIRKTTVVDRTPFSGLTPDVVLDGAASVGFEGEGILFALNSYENRVYQLGRGEGAVVLKFYRPARWSDAQIIEEHAFATELAVADLPVAAPIAVGGDTLLRYREFRFAVFPWQRGRAPELDAHESRAILGRSLARIHQVGAARAFVSRMRFTIERLGWHARKLLLASELLPESLADRYADVTAQLLLESVSAEFTAVGGFCRKCAFTATAISAMCSGTKRRPGLRRSRRLPDRAAHAGFVDAARRLRR
jgi:Ser/Thr protein kinase RdoA (MazF antagonist)